VLRSRDEWLEEPLVELQELFINSARDHRLTPSEVMEGYFLLYKRDPKQHKLLLSLRLHKTTSAAALTTYNFLVAEDCGHSFVMDHGKQLETLEWPLFPPFPMLRGLNTQLLADTSPVVGGGRAKRIPRVYENATAASPSGGATCPIVQLPDGSHATDVTEIETAFCELKRETYGLRQRNDAMLADNAALRHDVEALKRALSTAGVAPPPLASRTAKSPAAKRGKAPAKPRAFGRGTEAQEN
jgi:hypothetical protein